MSANLVPSPFMQFFTAGGIPLVGGKLYTYLAGTTTPLATYTDASGATANTNPVILNSRGEAAVWVGAAAYKFKLTDANDVEIWTADNIGDHYDSSSIVYTPAGTGAVATTVQVKLRQSVSVFDFLTSAQIADVQANTAAVNVTAGFQAAINYAQTSGYGLYIPAGTYKTSTTLSITARIHMFGDDAKTSTIQSTAAEAIVVTVASGYGNTFSHFHDFGVEPTTAGTGTSGFVCRLVAGGYMSNFVIERVYIGDFGVFGLVLDNSVANANGFFTCTIRRCWVTNGINLIKVGDSINVEENTITDGGTVAANHAGGRQGILYTGLAGARQVVFRSNNITTSGGAVVAISAEQMRIENNQCEHPFYAATPYGASTVPSYNAQIYLYDSILCALRGNTFQTGGAALVTATGTTTTGSPTVTGLSTTTGVYVGCSVQATGIPTSTRILTLVGTTATLTANATASGSVTLSIGYAPDAAIELAGSSNNCTFASNDVFLGTYWHYVFGTATTHNQTTEPSTYEGAPLIGTYPLEPSGGGTYMPIFQDQTNLTWSGVLYNSIEDSDSAYTQDPIFFNPFVDIWNGTNPANTFPAGFTAPGAATAARNTATVYPGNPAQVSVQVTSNGTTINNGVEIVPANQPWQENGWISGCVAIYTASAAGGVNVYGVTQTGVSVVLLGRAAATNGWTLVRFRFRISTGGNWAIRLATVNASDAYVSGQVFYVGGVNLVRGPKFPTNIQDAAARRTYVTTGGVGYAPSFIGARAYLSGTGKWYMAADQQTAADWIILN